MWQIKSYNDMIQAIRALTIQKIFEIRIVSQKFLQNETFFSFSLKYFDLNCIPRKDTKVYIECHHSYSPNHFLEKTMMFRPNITIIRLSPWTLAEFRHNRIVQSPHENHFNICRQYEEKFPQGEREGETMLTYYSKSTIKCRVLKKIIIFLVVGNNKTIHAPTSRDCYFY